MRCSLLRRCLITAAALLFFTTHVCHSESGSTPDPEQTARFLYREFREVKAFAMIAVSLVGQTETIGLKTDEVTQFAKSKFKDYFANVELEDIAGDSKRFLAMVLSREKTMGNITFRVWVVGEDYPIVYHVKCDAGNFDNPSVWTEEILGHGTKGNARDAIMGLVDEMMKTLAVAFFKVKARAT